MDIKLNQSALESLGNEIASRAEVAFTRGTATAEGQPLTEAVEAVAGEFAKAGLEPNREGIRTKLVELGWE